jgi:hypothetical protein
LIKDGGIVTTGPSFSSYEILVSSTNDATTIDNINLAKEITFIDVVPGGGLRAMSTLLDGTVIGQQKYISIRSWTAPIANPSTHFVEIKINNYLEANGTSGTQSLEFDRPGQGSAIIWNGLQWQCSNSGAFVSASTF